MAEWQVNPDFPNVLLVADEDIYALGDVDFAMLHEFLELGVSPVRRRGETHSHEWWIVNPRPESGGGIYFPQRVTREISDPDLDAVPDGRAWFRGDVRLRTMRDLDTATTAQAENELIASIDELAQEFAHYWLVPSDLEFESGRATGGVPFVEAAIAGREFPALSLLGRGGIHWSTYFDSDGSPMDGVHWQEEEEIVRSRLVGERFRRMGRYLNTAGTGFGFDSPLPSGGMLRAHCVYSDLDLVLMGVLQPGVAYPTLGNELTYFHPQWMEPCNFHTGLGLFYSNDRILSFGFLSSFRRLFAGEFKATRNSSAVDVDYEPWTDTDRVLLRIVRQGDMLHFQAHLAAGRGGCLGGVLRGLGLYNPPPRVDPFGELASIPPPSAPRDWTGWNTIASIRARGQGPVGVGFLTKTWAARNRMPIIDTSFSPLLIRTGRSGHEVLDAGNATSSAAYLEELRRDAFTFHVPKEGPLTRLSVFGRNLVVSPSWPNAERTNFDHRGAYDFSSGLDDAPKLVTRAPRGDFVAASSVRIDRDLMVPWAAGDTIGTTMWAYPRRVRATDLLRKRNAAFARRWSGIPYTLAFIVVAPRMSEITEAAIRDVDRLRRAADDYLPKATRLRRSFDTRLERS